jgi:hypothetical protein
MFQDFSIGFLCLRSLRINQGRKKKTLEKQEIVLVNNFLSIFAARIFNQGQQSRENLDLGTCVNDKKVVISG